MSQYIALFKPYGVLSSFTHEERTSQRANRLSQPKRTLSEFGLPKGVYAAGRLDYDSEGLLLLSDDGLFIHRLTDPRYKLPKTYFVQVEGAPTEAALERLRRGLAIKDYRTQSCQARVLEVEPALPSRAKPVTPHGPTAWLEIVLSEGKKRQVRHMTAAIGLPTLRLVRVAVGPVTIEGLLPGQWRRLTERELDSIIGRQLGINRPHAPTRSKPSPRSGRGAKREPSTEN